MRISLALLLAVLSLAVSATGQVQNPGFETGDFTGWNTEGTGTTFAVTTGNQYSGTYCAELTGTDGSLIDVNQEIPVLPNTRYFVSFYFKTVGSLVAWDSHLDEYDADHVYANKTDGLSTPAGSTPVWTMVSSTITTGPNTYFVSWRNRANVPNGAKLFLDSYSLVEVGPADGVTNGGFEIGTFLGWNTEGSGATFGINADSQHGGDYCAELTGTTGTLIDLNQEIPVQPNTGYTVSFWFKTVGSLVAWDSHFDELDASHNYAGKQDFLSTPAGSTPSWTQVTLVFTTGPNTHYVSWRNRANIPNGVKLFLDDYVLRLTPTCEGTPCNGGFETGYVDFWTLAGSGADVAATDGGTIGPKSGAYCLEFTGTTGELRHVEQNFTGLTPGVTYEASAYYRTSTAIGAIGITLVEFNPAGDVGYSLITGGAENKPAWTKVSVIFTARAGSTSYTWHNDANVPNGVSLFIDDCKIRVAPECVGVPCNGGFETGDTDFWTTWGSGANFGVTDLNPHTGTYAAHITGNSADEEVVQPLSGMDQEVTVNPNTTYIASMWYRSTGNWINDAWDSKILVLNASGGIVSGGVHSLGIPAAAVPEWTNVQVTFVTPEDAAKIRWNNQFDVHSTDHMYLDDLQLAEVTYTAFGSVGEARSAGQGAAGTMDVVVTRVIDEAHFFVESPDRSSGILVESPEFALEAWPNPGDVLHVRGWITTSSYVDPYSMELVFPGMLVFRTDALPTPGTPSQVDPLRPIGSILRPLLTGASPVLDGMFVKVGGVVTSKDESGRFWINDGSGADFGVAYNYFYIVNEYDAVAVTGCIVSSNGERWLYITGLDEIQQLLPE